VSLHLRAATYVQGLLEVCRVHLLAQRRLLARRGKALELPGLVGAVLDQIGAEGDRQLLGQYGRGDEVIPTLEGRHGLTGERPLLALEATVLVIEVGAGEGERPAPGQEAAISEQGAELVLYQGGQRLGGDDRQGCAPCAAPEQIG